MTPRLIAVRAGSLRHLEYVAAGYRTHHSDGNILWLEEPTLTTKADLRNQWEPGDVPEDEQ